MKLKTKYAESKTTKYTLQTSGYGFYHSVKVETFSNPIIYQLQKPI